MEGPGEAAGLHQVMSPKPAPCEDGTDDAEEKKRLKRNLTKAKGK